MKKSERIFAVVFSLLFAVSIATSAFADAGRSPQQHAFAASTRAIQQTHAVRSGNGSHAAAAEAHMNAYAAHVNAAYAPGATPQMESQHLAASRIHGDAAVHHAQQGQQQQH